MAPKSTRGQRPSESQHRGRPVGSIKLAAEAEANILTYIEAGAADYIAAEIAGIDARTFRDYVQRGLSLHPTRASTPRLARFAKAVMQAKARARAAREIEAADHHVTFWLTHMARSKPDREGWTDPMESDADGPAPQLYQPTMDEAAETLRVLIDAGVLSLREASSQLPPADEVAEANGG